MGQNGVQWHTLVNSVMYFQASQKARHFLTKGVNVSFKEENLDFEFW